MSELFLLKGQFPNDIFNRTADYIASVQEKDGSIPWYRGGYTDPWDHVEAAMGLSVCGRLAEAEKAYDWMIASQNADGSWWNAFKDGVVEDDSRVESNFVAYIATGVWHHFMIKRDAAFLNRLWPTVEAAIEFVLGLQTKHGEICWAVDTKLGVCRDALITGCSSIYKSLECAINIAAALGKKKHHWKVARSRLGSTLRNHPERFDRTWESKSRYAMDWFYPVLTGVISGAAGRNRINRKWDIFVVENLGCRCVCDEPWVTIAESSELTMALLASGNYKKATRLFSWLHQFREENGAYWTGYVYSKTELWPDEKPTWTAGAVLLAADALAEVTAASHLFTTVPLTEIPHREKRFEYA